MANVTNELMFEVLKNLRTRLDGIDAGVGEVCQEIVALRLAQLAMNPDTHNIHGILARRDGQLDRIERRLELHELSESQRPYEPR